MLVGVIMAGVNMIVHINSEASAIIDTILLIARAVMAVLYGRVIHSLRHEEPILSEEKLEEMIERIVHEVIEAETQKDAPPPVTVQEVKPTGEAVIENPSLPDTISRLPGPKIKPTQEIDEIVWPLLNTGMTVRAIAQQAGTSTATVGRSRKRWERARAV
jgi:DNA-binding NarL/FixJ family response regulator